jgi:hypothetical protein
MPDIVQGRMPCFVGLKSAIDKKLAWLLSRQIVNSQSLRNFRLMVKEQLTHGFFEEYKEYLVAATEERRNPTVEATAHYAQNGKKISPFGNVDDDWQKGWGMVVPSLPFLSVVLLLALQKLSIYSTRFAMNIISDIIDGDMTFKIAKVASHTSLTIFNF